jgi:hypothetical protein
LFKNHLGKTEIEIEIENYETFLLDFSAETEFETRRRGGFLRTTIWRGGSALTGAS